MLLEEIWSYGWDPLAHKYMSRFQIRPYVPAKAPEVAEPTLDTITNFCKLTSALEGLVATDPNVKYNIRDVVDKLSSTQNEVRLKFEKKKK